jgi:hypothetical protein
MSVRVRVCAFGFHALDRGAGDFHALGQCQRGQRGNHHATAEGKHQAFANLGLLEHGKDSR